MKLLIKFPTRGRKQKFFKVFNQYQNLCEDLDNTYFLVTLDNDDEDMSRWAFWATGISVFVFWNIATAIGAFGASFVADPKSLGLDAAVGAAFLALLWPRLINKQIRVVGILAGLLALGLTPFVQPGIPVLASVLIAIGMGLKNASDT